VDCKNAGAGRELETDKRFPYEGQRPSPTLTAEA
jgi:hypothetical protein